MNITTVIIMTRWPAPGRCKKRLSKYIGIERASRVQSHLINHSIKVVKTIESQGLVEIQLAVSGLAPKASRRWAKQYGIKNVTSQGSGNLGVEMRRQIIIKKEGYKSSLNEFKSVIILGTDLPSLTHTDLTNALDKLATNDMVIGPSSDGGYWLIGLSEKLINPLVFWPFSGIPWGSNKVLEATVKKANKANISFSMLRVQNDLDTLSDMKPWLM